MSLFSSSEIGAEKEQGNILPLWGEVCGNVNEVLLDERLIIFENFILKVIDSDISFIKNVEKYRGKNIAIIRTDISTEPYRFRVRTRQSPPGVPIGGDPTERQVALEGI